MPTRYTAQHEVSFGPLPETRAVIPDSGTSLTFEVWSGSEWVADGMSPITQPQQIFTRNVRIRLTPDTGGFLIDDGGRL